MLISFSPNREDRSIRRYPHPLRQIPSNNPDMDPVVLRGGGGEEGQKDVKEERYRRQTLGTRESLRELGRCSISTTTTCYVYFISFATPSLLTANTTDTS